MLFRKKLLKLNRMAFFITWVSIKSDVISLIYSPLFNLERSSRAMSAINAAINLWQTQTCVRFKKGTNENAYVYVHIGQG